MTFFCMSMSQSVITTVFYKICYLNEDFTFLQYPNGIMNDLHFVKSDMAGNKVLC